MKRTEYVQKNEACNYDLELYSELLKDIATAPQVRLQAILEAFEDLNVPESYDREVEEIWEEGLQAIGENSFGEEMLKYAPLIWSLPGSVSDAVYHVAEQLLR